MKTINRYLWKATLNGLLIAWVALLILDMLFAFINEAGNTNELYSTSQAFIYLIYTVPSVLYERFPFAILVGTLLGLGNLAANSEFVAMRAAGISIRQIILSVLKLGILLVIGVFLIGEWVVPEADLQARNFKAHLKNPNITLTGDQGIWVKEKNKIMHIGKVFDKNQISAISVYTLKDDFSGLESHKTIASAKFTGTEWELENIHTSEFEQAFIKKQQQAKARSTDFLNTQILEVATVDPEQLSSSALGRIIKHQQDNQIKTDRYELIYWKRFAVPLSSLVMLILAMPFLFGSNRGGGVGQRVFIGIVIGIVFYLANRAINELGIVYGFSPFLSAFLPVLVFLGLGFLTLSRIK